MCIRDSILSKHKISILEITRRIAPSMNIDSQLYWDIYKQAIAVKEREGFPFVGVSVDRRSFDYTLEVYNDKNIKCLMCFGCARILLHTGHKNDHISYVNGNWLYNLPKGMLLNGFSLEVYRTRYMNSGSPLAYTGANSLNVNLDDWYVDVDPMLLAKLRLLSNWHESDLYAMDELSRSRHAEMRLICCPEDHMCVKDCKENKKLCAECVIPICKECREALTSKRIPPKILSNDNFYGYIEKWIFEQEVTWMEKTVAMPFWTSMLLFAVDSKKKKNIKKHTMHDVMFQNTSRVSYKGQVYSAPMNLKALLHQLESTPGPKTPIVPVTGLALAARVKIVLSSGIASCLLYTSDAADE